MMRNFFFLTGALAGLALAACGGGGTTDGGGNPDLGPGPDGGTGSPDIGVEYYDYDTLTSMTLPPVSGAMDADGGIAMLNTSCVGMANVPSETGTPMAAMGHAKDFQYGTDVVGASLNFYANDDIPFDHGCTGTCQNQTTDGMGDVTGLMDVSNSWYAYYMGATTGADMAHSAVPTAEFHEPFDVTGLTMNSVSQQTLTLIPTLIGLRRQAGTSIIAGTVYDCDDKPVKGLVIRVFDQHGNLIREPYPPGGPGSGTMAGYRYFGDTDLPSSSQYYTNDNGLYAAANMPAPTDGKVRIEAWGNIGGAPHMWGCEEVNVFADGVTIINVRPYRSDGPTNCTEMPSHL